MSREILEIVYSPTLSIWKSSFDNSKKALSLKESYKIIKNNPNLKDPSKDLYTYYKNTNLGIEEYFGLEVKNSIDAVMKEGLDSCLNLIDIDTSNIEVYVWINRVKKENAVQPAYTDDFRFHNHVATNTSIGLAPPLFTFVSYIQMPNNLEGKEGTLLLKDKDGEIYSTLPKEGEILIFQGDVPHVPLPALNSTQDRMVIAGAISVKSNSIL